MQVKRANRALTIVWFAMCIALSGCLASSGDSPESTPAPSTTAAARTASSASPDATISKPTESAAADGDWPTWRGPHGDGISTETDWTSDWPSAGPKKLWSAEVGTGFSSCTVGRGRLYTLGHEPNSPEREKAGKFTDDTVWCFDAATGGEIWRYRYLAPQIADLNEGGPGATPTVDGNRVYTVSKWGDLFCFEAAGDGSGHAKVLWKQDLQSLLDVTMPEWGFSGSPRVLGDMLILDAGRTVALNKLTGGVIWKTAKFRPGYGTPTLFNMGGKPYVAVLNNDALLVLRADDGTEVDKAKWETQYITTAISPIVRQKDGQTSIFVSGFRAGCACLI